MYIGGIKKSDIANGPGIRVSVFVSGCTNRCKGCFQPQTWDFTYGEVFTKELEDSVIAELHKTYYQGLTILGGEPFELENQPGVLQLIERVKKEVPQADIWAYTGFLYDVDLQPGGKRFGEHTTDILDQIDVLVDGKFEEDQYSIMLRFRGSRNQRIIDLKKTRREGQIVLSPLQDEN